MMRSGQWRGEADDTGEKLEVTSPRFQEAGKVVARAQAEGLA